MASRYSTFHQIAVTALPLAAALAAAVPAFAQETWQNRQHWDWGQHGTSLAEEMPDPPAAPAQHRDHWDYPGAPVRFAGGPAAE